MIQIQQLKDKSLEEAIKSFETVDQSKLLDRLKSETTYTHFVVYDGEKILGISQYRFLDADIAMIDCIYITPTERKLKLGDGLLRATLNSIEIRKGSSVIFYVNDEECSFYSHIGFSAFAPQVITSKFDIENIVEDRPLNCLMYLDSISDFFDQPCKSSVKR